MLIRPTVMEIMRVIMWITTTYMSCFPAHNELGMSRATHPYPHGVVHTCARKQVESLLLSCVCNTEWQTGWLKTSHPYSIALCQDPSLLLHWLSHSLMTKRRRQQLHSVCATERRGRGRGGGGRTAQGRLSLPIRQARLQQHQSLLDVIACRKKQKLIRQSCNIMEA